jgi:hypothetical protein
MKRQPFRVTVRRMATGCDYSKTLFLHSASDAFDVMARHVRWRDGIAKEHLRLVDCVPFTQAEAAAEGQWS